MCVSLIVAKVEEEEERDVEGGGKTKERMRGMS